MKKEVKRNYRIVVHPDITKYGTDERIADRQKEACEEMLEQILRHVDSVNKIETEVVHDIVTVCSDCGVQWDEISGRCWNGCGEVK